ncbi:peptidoglycan bridge formation glycyltransferase FemA/FemB family protein [Candidatus Gracilibacteria bacterium]|nr:peptidoglycan bridge formation glycyltransferase FemA/FemB family protein [Candidatus Gracilibacteria bacterium]
MKARILREAEFGRWDEFVGRLGCLEQLTKWGRFSGRGKFWVVGLFEGEDLVGGCLVVRRALPLGFCWFYGARGPVVKEKREKRKEKKEAIEVLRGEVARLGRREKAIFWRIDPGVSREEEFLAEGFRFIEEGFYPQTTLMVDLSLSEEEILAQMKQKGRYNVRLAAKKGVVVRRDDQAVGEFWRLLKETTERDGFSGHGEEYYQRMISELGENAGLYVAEFEGEVLAAAIVTFFGKVATYYYGVSGNARRELMAPYLLHFEIMKEAKAAGFEKYDLFGIAPLGCEEGHAWEGVTRFKRQFGGEEVNYARPQEFAFKRFWYWVYRGWKKARKLGS